MSGQPDYSNLEALHGQAYESTKKFLNAFAQWTSMSKKLEQTQVSDRLRLNVGSTIFTTTLATLRNQPGSYFDAMLSDLWSLQTGPDSEIFVDRDATAFRHVLNFLREGEIDRSIMTKEEVARLHKDAEFYALPKLAALLLKAETVPICFAHCGPNIRIMCEGRSAINSSCSHQHAVAMPALPDSGQVLQQVTIRSLQANGWIYLGVISNPSPLTTSYSDAGSYGWANREHVYRAGQDNTGLNGWKGFQTGDKVVLKVDRDASLLTMRVERLGTQTFSMAIPQGTLYLHANLYGLNDQVDIIPDVDPDLRF